MREESEKMMKESKTSSVEMTDLKKKKSKELGSDQNNTSDQYNSSIYSCFYVYVISAVSIFAFAYVISGFIDPGFVPFSERAYFVPFGIGVIFLCIMMIFMLLSFMYMDLEHGALSDLSFSYVPNRNFL